jgi:hypothetical protein
VQSVYSVSDEDDARIHRAASLGRGELKIARCSVLGARALAAAILLHGVATAVAALASPSEQPGDLPLTQRRFLLGLGHHPAHKPGETPADLQKALIASVEVAARHSEVFSLWTMAPWPEEWAGFYARPSLEQRQAVLRQYAQRHLAPIFNLNFWTVVPEPGRGLALKLVLPADLPPETTMASAAFRQRWLAHVTRLAREFQPVFLSLGNEIDSFYHYGPAQARDFDHYATLVAESYDAIKAVSPRTRVLVIFRYEEMAAKKGFDLIKKFKKIDLFGFTTYPDLRKFPSPAAIPSDYYRPIADRVGPVPVAFTEIGWATVPGDAEGERHQAEFLRWFLRETRSLNLEMVIWPFLHDLAPPEKKAPRSSYLGLQDYYGQPKPAWSLWQKLAALPRGK